MAFNPNIIMLIAEGAKSEKIRKIVLYIVFMSLGVVMLIAVTFSALVSGLLAIMQDTDLRNHWNYFKNSLSDVFTGIESNINTDIKDEVYDFMPDFSVNLSKATIANNFDGNSLILYDEAEMNIAEDTMQDYARRLRNIANEEQFDEYISDYDTSLSFSDISDISFSSDNGINNINDYSDELKTFLYNRAMEQMPAYSYTYDDVIIDGKSAAKQTLVVTSPNGGTQTVEYTCIGGGEIYLPEFLAMYHIRQSREFLVEVTENQAPDIDAQLQETIGNIPDDPEEAEEYINGSWNNIIDGRGGININIFDVSNLKSLVENASMDGAVQVSTERTSDKLSITLETMSSELWGSVFDIDDNLWQYVEEEQNAIEMCLEDSNISREEWTISLDNMVQLALFVYFEGFFELPVDSSDLAYGNGILSQCGDVSDLHRYTYGTNTYGVPEKGITLELTGETAIHANLLDCGSCVQDIIVYDVWNMEEQSVANTTQSKVYNRSAVTLAYIIDTDQFEEDYGFPFPSIDGVSNTGTVTLFLEFTCLSEVRFEDYDIGSSLLDFGDIVVGYSHDGYYSEIYDRGLWRHSINRNECIPHVCIKTYFMSGEVTPPESPQGTHNYGGPSSADIGVAVNPRFWFKGFRTGMDEDLLDTLKTISS